MKNKRGQFYLVAVLVIIATFVGLLTVENFARTQKNIVTNDLSLELSSEKMNVLDYLANVNSDDSDSDIILTNFSKTYIDKIGRNKNILFIIGKQTTGKIIGYSLNDSNLSYNIGNGLQEIDELGEFEINIIPSTNNLEFFIDGNLYPFELNKGQNIYYLIKHEYNNEVHIISG